MKTRRWSVVAGLASAVLLPSPLLAVVRTWTGGGTHLNTSWIDPNNWSPTAVPLAGDDVRVFGVNGLDNFINYNYVGPNITLNSLTVNHANLFAFTATTGLNLSSGSLTAASESVGDTRLGGTRGRGVFNHSGGTNTLASTTHLFLGYNPTDSGTYNFSGGIFDIPAGSGIDVGVSGSGFFNQSGLSSIFFHAPGTLTLGGSPNSTGTFNFTGGQMQSAREVLGFGGTGIFNHSAGTNDVETSLILGNGANSSGTYNLSGTAQLAIRNFSSGTFAGLFVGHTGTGVFNHSAGSNIIYQGTFYLGFNAGAHGTYTLSGSGALTTLNSEYVGYNGAGTFIHTGGTHSVVGPGGLLNDGNLYLGYQPGSSGSYALAGNGFFTCGALTIGGQGTGEFSQSGGTVFIAGTVQDPFASILLIGRGSYALSDGLLALTNGSEIIGAYTTANGSFTQTGGTHTLSGVNRLYIGNGASSSTFLGVYSLAGGTLSSPAISVLANGRLIISAGTLSPPNLAIFGGVATFSNPANKLASLLLSHTGSTYSGQLNLTTSRLILPTTSASDKSAQIADLLAAITVGSASNTWTGNGLTFDLALAADYSATGSHATTMALIDNADLNLAAVNGIPVDTSSLIVARALLGDSNLDNVVDALDFDTWFKNVGQTNAFRTSRGDFNLSGVVDAVDFDTWFTHVGLILAPLFPSSPIPEPSTLLLTLPILLFRRRPASRRDKRRGIS